MMVHPEGVHRRIPSFLIKTMTSKSRVLVFENGEGEAAEGG